MRNINKVIFILLSCSFSPNVRTEKDPDIFLQYKFNFSSCHFMRNSLPFIMSGPQTFLTPLLLLVTSPRTTRRIAVYHFDNLHYSSNTILSRPPTVPRRSNPNLGDAPMFSISPQQKISLSF